MNQSFEINKIVNADPEKLFEKFRNPEEMRKWIFLNDAGKMR